MQTFPILRAEDVRVAKNGENGADIKLSKISRRVIPYQFECKNKEKFATLYSFYKQGRKHGRLEPVLVCKMNDNKPLAVIDLEHFFEIIKE